ncbi:saccharopine dehydrogenase NADP-binding domain-containing protein [Planctomycetota bacterium]|nr:saccharopine dehydrogenase NADP-binding domain-containing protein [Planctomycetota bacterium]
MKRILVLGAGKSATVLIDFLLKEAQERGWTVGVGDLDPELAAHKVAGRPCGESFKFDVNDAPGRRKRIEAADLVISMLPASLHPMVAEDCIHYGVHFASASYVGDEMRQLSEAAERAGVVLLNELGVDPGIDHMSAMQQIDRIKDSGAKIVRFETFTGGLVAPQSDDNPWRYKFTWNPRNVVLAGQGVVKFKHNGRFKYIPYHRLFGRFEMLDIPGYGSFEGYPNRDSLKYIRHYGLWGCETIYRGTLRRPGFCKAWDCLVQLGLTDDTYVLEDLSEMTWREYVNSYLWYDSEMSVELKIRAYLKLEFNSPELEKLKWLGLFDNTPIGMDRGTPAQVLQKKLEEKWGMGADDQDMIAMLHLTEYELPGGKREVLQSSMVCVGDDGERTAMAKTVGLPLGIGALRVLDGTIERRGIVIPTVADVYDPVLAELTRHGIEFKEKVTPVS